MTVSPSARASRRVRAVRVEDQLWCDAMETAGRRGDTLSEVIRDGLRRYVARNRKTPGKGAS